jgi:hypothetical protein
MNEIVLFCFNSHTMTYNQAFINHCLGNQDGTKIKKWDEEAGQGWREKGQTNDA